jgi:predicted nuclease with TOPRIM domain
VNSEPVHYQGSVADSAASDPFSGSSPKLDRLIDGVRSLEQWYAADFERRISGLTELLKLQITEELRTQFSSELNSHVDRVRKQYEERIYTQAGQWESQRQMLEREIEDLKKRLPNNDVMAEIASTEAVMGAPKDRASVELERLIPDSASFGKLLQARVEDLTMKAYLRGLRFRLPTDANR